MSKVLTFTEFLNNAQIVSDMVDHNMGHSETEDYQDLKPINLFDLYEDYLNSPYVNPDEAPKISYAENIENDLMGLEFSIDNLVESQSALSELTNDEVFKLLKLSIQMAELNLKLSNFITKLTRL